MSILGRYRKEWFCYGGGGAAWPKGWEDYAGVELPLCYWEREYQRLQRLEVEERMRNRAVSISFESCSAPDSASVAL